MFSSPISLGHVNCGSKYNIINSAAKLTGGERLDGLGMVLNLCTHKCLVPPPNPDCLPPPMGLSPQIKIKALNFQYKYTPQN